MIGLTPPEPYDSRYLFLVVVWNTEKVYLMLPHLRELDATSPEPFFLTNLCTAERGYVRKKRKNEGVRSCIGGGGHDSLGLAMDGRKLYRYRHVPIDEAGARPLVTARAYFRDILFLLGTRAVFLQ